MPAASRKRRSRVPNDDSCSGLTLRPYSSARTRRGCRPNANKGRSEPEGSRKVPEKSPRVADSWGGLWVLLVVLVRPEAHSGNQNESLARKEDTGDDRGSGRTPQKAGY